MQTTDAAVCDDPLAAFYTDGLTLLETSGIPFLVGGTFAFARHTNIDRPTKDLDIFVRPSDLKRTLSLFGDNGYETELTFPHWLAKISRGLWVIDLIFSSGNGIARVDDEWFAHAVEGVVLGKRLLLCPPEELIWSKAFVLERERYDGADVAHLLREAGRDIDWRRLLTRFGARWPVLFSHLTLFYFIYPDQRDVVPAGLMEELAGRLTRLRVEPENNVCFGTLLSREQYLPDLERHRYLDARVNPYGSLTPDEVRTWTEAIEKQ